ncbi:MAG: DsbA family protein [Flavobacteriales bacterium]|nr:DsbA family protein [Flavobacteriales bacterium]
MGTAPRSGSTKAWLAAAALCLASPAFPQSPSTQEKTTNPLHCDPGTGLCVVPGPEGAARTSAFKADAPQTKLLTLHYFTDPICSSCWGAEPQLRRLKLEYGALIDIQYHMGGLLPSWAGFNGGAINSPTDVAGHWDEVSPHYRMPIIGDVWLEDPLPSSFPPSIAFKAAQLQDPAKALVFLRRQREQVLTEKKNITKWPVIAEAAQFAGLDTVRLRSDFAGAAPSLFQADLTLARSLGVRGFPTFLFTNAAGERHVVHGARPYPHFGAAVQRLAPEAKAAAMPTTLEGLLAVHASWCAEEVAVVLGTTHAQAEELLRVSEGRGELAAVHTRNGSVWRRK